MSKDVTRTKTTYVDEGGKTHKRLKCSIKNCKCIRRIQGGTQRLTCQKHLKTGEVAPYYKRPHRKLKTMWRWKAQGIKITHVEYDNLLYKQKGCCALCGIHHSEVKKRLSVDHNHKTEQIRGLLCVKCNLLVGIVEDGFGGITVQEAEEYLQRYKVIEIISIA